jgi:serine/threonine-protein kinase
MSSEDHLAEEGSVMGTASYFSPEQAEGANVDGRSDVYSLGVVLYEMLVGRPPFIGDSPVEVSSQHVHSTVPKPSEFNDNVPRDLESIVMQALAKSQGQRYQTADEFRADLIRFTEGQPVRAAGYDGAFFGADATRAVATVQGGERTQAVPIMTGPRTDVRRRRNNNTGIIAAVVILLLAAGGLSYFLLASKTTITSMPNLVGQTLSSASQTLRTDGLFIGSVSPVSSDKTKGTVVSTNPAAGGKVKGGQSVTLRVSLGQTAKPVIVPTVTGLSLSAAEVLLGTKSLGYHVAYLTSSTSTQPPGTVIQQNPIAGASAKTGDTVTLSILAPTTTYPVPSTGGQTPVAATSTLVSQGLTVSSTTTSKCSNTVASGLVLGTLPPSGTEVKSGTSIELVTSSGVCQVVVPSVVTDTQTAAQAALTAQGLQSSFSEADPTLCTTAQIGTVLTQSPGPGTQAPFNSLVNMTVCDSSTAPGSS